MPTIADFFHSLLTPTPAPVESNVLDATQAALQRLQTTGVAGGNAIPTNAIENRVKILDPVRDDWVSKKTVLSSYGISIGDSFGGAAFVGGSSDYDTIENAMNVSGLAGNSLAMSILTRLGVKLDGGKFVRHSINILAGTLSAADFHAYYSSAVNAYEFNWQRCPNYDWSLPDTLIFGNTYGGGLPATTYAGATKFFPVAVPFGKLIWIVRNTVGGANVQFTSEVY